MKKSATSRATKSSSLNSQAGTSKSTKKQATTKSAPLAKAPKNITLKAKSSVAPGKSKPKQKLASWQSSWPTTPDLRAWLLCGIRKCAANPNIEEGSIDAYLHIEALAELGHVAEALKHLARFLKKVPKDKIVESTRLAKLGAKICFEAGDMPSMESYLELVRSADDRVTRKGDKGFGSHCVHEFKVLNGLIPPGELSSDHEDILPSAFYFHCRQLKIARQSEQTSLIKKELTELIRIVAQEKLDWRQSMWTRYLLRLAHEVSDTDAVKQLIAQIPPHERDERIGHKIYAMIGMNQEAAKSAQQEIEKRIAELLTKQDPNIHFPIHDIAQALTFLIEIGEKKLATSLFEKVAESASSWYCIIKGWTTTAVLAAFVPIVEQLEGKEAAQELAELAEEHASRETHSGFKRGAQATALAASASLKPIANAIEQARKIRSPAQKRMELGKLLARAGRWKELKELLSTVASPHEAARLAWWIKFELPGGDIE